MRLSIFSRVCGHLNVFGGMPENAQHHLFYEDIIYIQVFSTFIHFYWIICFCVI